MARLGGKVAVVTGAASGFGRATAHRLAAEGACVVVADLDEGNAEVTVAQIVEQGGLADVFIGDVSDRVTAEAMVGRAVSRFGGLNVLVNNAGIVQERPKTGSWDIEEQQWDDILRVNLRSVYVCCRAAVPAMRTSGGGSIVNIASIAASVSVGGVAYAASKGGMLSYTRHIAVEVAPDIRVNCVSPGYMWTPMSTGERSGLTTEQQQGRRELLGGMSPMARVGAADDIANAVLFLASDEAGFVTGQEVVVDGGHLVASWPRPTTPIA
jgi:NAD(P)-dependent dehydrogenase (short-subunit alcohol dehydrogenase family)